MLHSSFPVVAQLSILFVRLFLTKLQKCSRKNSEKTDSVYSASIVKNISNFQKVFFSQESNNKEV